MSPTKAVELSPLNEETKYVFCNLAAGAIELTSLYFTNPVTLSLTNISESESSLVIALKVKPLNSIKSSCTVIGEQPYKLDV